VLGHPHLPMSSSLLLLLANTQQQDIIMFKVVTRYRAFIRQHLPMVRQSHARSTERTPCRLEESVSKGRHKKRERKILQYDDRAVEFPFGR